MMRLVGAAFLVALALVAAGCGGSSDSAADDTTAIESTATATETTDGSSSTEETTETETTETETTEETTSGDTETVATVDEGAIADILGSEDCAELVSVGSKFAQAMSGASGTSTEDTTKYFDELAENAPEEIRDDFAVLAEAWTAIVEVYSEMGLELGQTPTPEQIEKFSEAGEELAKKLDDPKFEQASENISTWANENCSANG